MREVYKVDFGSREVHCKVHVDFSTGTIHILDLDGSLSLTNGIDYIQENLMKRHNLSGNIGDWNWILYGTDGVASLFNGDFVFAPGQLIHMPFINRSNAVNSNWD